MNEKLLDFVIVGSFNNVLGSFRLELDAEQYREELQKCRNIQCKVVPVDTFLKQAYHGLNNAQA